MRGIISKGTIANASSGSLKAVDRRSPYADAIQVANQEAAIVIRKDPPSCYKGTAKYDIAMRITGRINYIGR